MREHPCFHYTASQRVCRNLEVTKMCRKRASGCVVPALAAILCTLVED